MGKQTGAVRPQEVDGDLGNLELGIFNFELQDELGLGLMWPDESPRQRGKTLSCLLQDSC